MADNPADPNRDLPPGLRLLVAEDNAINRSLCARLLQAAGHTVLEAETGRQALDRLAASGVDAVLMDLQMPDMDGLAATRTLRQGGEGSARLPVIALSASGSAADYEACLAAGMDGFLPKPVSRDRLLAELARHVGPRAASGAVAAAAAGAAPSNDTRTTADGQPRLDTAALAATTASLGAGEPAMLVEMLGERIASLAAALDAARQAGEPSGLAAPGHKLKSACQYLGLMAASAQARDLEAAAAEGDHAAALARGEALLAGLRADRQRLAEALDLPDPRASG